MGFSISWIAVRETSATTLLEALDLRRTDVREEVPESMFTAVVVGGWFIAFANDCAFADGAPLADISKCGELVACAVEEHIGASGASAYARGRFLWRVNHDSDRGLFDLQVRGSMPDAFAQIRDRLSRQLAAAGGKHSEVDYLFDAPVQLAQTITGFRHDQVVKGTFEVLEHRTRRTKSPSRRA